MSLNQTVKETLHKTFLFVDEMGKYFCNGDQKYGLPILSIRTYRTLIRIYLYIDNVGHDYYACNVIHLKLKINSGHAGIFTYLKSVCK